VKSKWERRETNKETNFQKYIAVIEWIIKGEAFKFVLESVQFNVPVASHG
jgi:hypothetical protein